MRIPITFEKLSMYERSLEPCMVALPFSQGRLTPDAVSRISILDDAKSIPSQCRATALWPDGSIKWLLVHFLADLPANAAKQFECCTDSVSVVPLNSVSVSRQEDSYFIDTGIVKVELNGPGNKGLFRSIVSSEAITLDGVSGPTMQDQEQTDYECVVGPEGWEVLESGPVRAVVQTKGKHVSGDERTWFDYTARIYAYAGKPWLRVDYQIINREQGEEQTIRSLNMRIDGLPGERLTNSIRTGLGKSNYATTIRTGQSGEQLSHVITAEELKYQGNEHLPEVMYGTFWGSWQKEYVGGFSVTLFQAQQNFPKLIDVSEAGIVIGIIPEETDLTMLQGMAKTHRLYIHVLGPEDGLEQVNVRSLQFQLPDRPVIHADCYEEAGVMEPLQVSIKLADVEQTLVNLADYRSRAYGMLHWGDSPDRNYTDQGRGKDEWVWTNNEYDLPHSMMHMYARKGDRRFLDYMLVAAEHWMDVDICHFSDDPLRYQGQIPHSAKHVTDNPAVCHEWVEGLLDYYHVTGEWRALESAIGIGENVLRILATPRFQDGSGLQARESGWALRSLGALFKETGDEKWLQPAESIVDQFETWMNKYGAWLSPYTDHTMVRVPFMVSVAVNSLMRYYHIRPQERIKKMIVTAVQDLLDHTYMQDEGMFIYKELPSLIKIGTCNPTILEALSYAYEFTGNTEYLDVGIGSFRSVMKRIERETGGMGKEISGDAVILWDGMGPKFFAQYYYPLFYYYRAAMKAGISL